MWMENIFKIGKHVLEQKFTKVFGLKNLLISKEFDDF